jgi:hypothetical protein
LLETSGTITLDNSPEPATITYNNALLANGTTILVLNTTSDVTLDYVASLATGTGYSVVLTKGTDYDEGDVIAVRITRKNGTTYYTEAQDVILAGVPTTVVDSATELALCSVCNAFGLDGASSTIDDKFSLDYVNNELDIVVGGSWTMAEAMVWWKYQMTIELPMTVFWNTNMVQADGSFYNDSDILPVNFDNGTSTDAIESSGRRFYRKDELRPIRSPTSGGGTIDLAWRVPVTAIETGTSGLTPDESATLTKINTIEPLCKLIPATV